MDTNLEAAPENTQPLDTIAAFDAKMKRLGIDFLYVPIPSIEEVYPENFLDTVPPDLTVQPAMRRLMLSLLERDVEVLDLLRPFQAARERLPARIEARRPLEQRADRAGGVARGRTAAPLRVRAGRGRSGQALHHQAGQNRRRSRRRRHAQVIAPSGKLYDDVERSPVLVVGDSNLQIYEYQNENLTRTGEHAGFTAHLARHLGLPVSLEASGGFRLAQLNREPELFEGAAWSSLSARRGCSRIYLERGRAVDGPQPRTRLRYDGGACRRAVTASSSPSSVRTRWASSPPSPAVLAEAHANIVDISQTTLQSSSP